MGKEKKEIWMEKLIKLLNEYDKTRDYYKVHTYIMYKDDEWIEVDDKRTDLEIISSSYWFIKRLVENDKIDFDNRDLKDRFMNEFERYPQFHNNTTNREFNVNGLLMLLSIQDKPIDFLISILKDHEDRIKALEIKPKNRIVDDEDEWILIPK